MPEFLNEHENLKRKYVVFVDMEEKDEKGRLLRGKECCAELIIDAFSVKEAERLAKQVDFNGRVPLRIYAYEWQKAPLLNPDPQLNILKMLHDSGLNPSDFKSEKAAAAVFYNELLSALINLFSQGRNEVTHSEYGRDGEVITRIFKCVDFFGKTPEDFGEFLIRNDKLIPNQLRDTLDAYIGFNYGNKGGILIRGRKIYTVDQEALDEVDTEDKVWNLLASPDQANRAYSILEQNIEEAILKK